MLKTYTIREIAELYQVSEVIAKQWVQTGQLHAVDVSVHRGSLKPRWRVTQYALDEFNAARSNNPHAPLKSRRRKKKRISGPYPE